MPSSNLYPGEMVIDDSSPSFWTDEPPGMSRGLDLGLRGPDGYGDTASAFPDELLVPESEWEERIKEMEERKTRLSDILDLDDIPCHDQNGTNYCWANGPVTAVEIVRAVMHQPYVKLSPASVAAPIKNYRNQGGWGKEALDYIIKHGVYPAEKWPVNSMNRSNKTSEGDAGALLFRVTEWWELRPRNRHQLISCVLRRIPVAVGYNWWSHEVTGVDAVWLSGTAALRIRNSWGMGWGSRGYSVLQGPKMLPDDAVAPRVAMAA